MKSTTSQIFRMYNFKLLCDILDKDFGDIVATSQIDPNKKVFQKQLTKKK